MSRVKKKAVLEKSSDLMATSFFAVVSMVQCRSSTGDVDSQPQIPCRRCSSFAPQSSGYRLMKDPSGTGQAHRPSQVTVGEEGKRIVRRLTERMGRQWDNSTKEGGQKLVDWTGGIVGSPCVRKVPVECCVGRPACHWCLLAWSHGHVPPMGASNSAEDREWINFGLIGQKALRLRKIYREISRRNQAKLHDLYDLTSHLLVGCCHQASTSRVNEDWRYIKRFCERKDNSYRILPASSATPAQLRCSQDARITWAIRRKEMI
ncbi:unnamed protein product [Nesidiocoris tenuis]|uniref:Uncharacterized protein n=1 Tax=Nesidiocoris tenuis TaxID=355587 RepID=A0A6H5G544_9HEMI|nr:unnamed protein product [Nesidiocoris tenuis]